MKMLIAYILATALPVLADPVEFTWTHNTEPDLAGYLLRIGPARYGANGLDHPDLQTHFIAPGINWVTRQIAPRHKAWLSAVDLHGHESLPAGPIEYKPVSVMLYVESAQVGVFGYTELKRIDETLFHPEMANLRTKLSISRSFVTVSSLDNKFYPQYASIDTTLFSHDFFRAFVVAQRLF